MSENNIAIFPKLKRYPTMEEGKTSLSPEDIDQISNHYTSQIFAGLRNQNLVSEKEILPFTLVKEFVNSIVFKHHNVYHPFTEIIEQILISQMAMAMNLNNEAQQQMHGDNDDGFQDPTDEAPEPAPDKPKRGRKPKAPKE